MRKLIIGILVALSILCLGAFLFYKVYLPSAIAHIITDAETPSYLPSFAEENLAKYKEPINKGASELVQALHDRNIPVEEVIRALDETTEAEIQAALDELKASDIKTTDQAFDIIASHVKTDLDIERLREPFKQHVNIQTIQRVLNDNDFKQYQDLLNASTIKEVVKEVLIQKEAEYQREHGS